MCWLTAVSVSVRDLARVLVCTGSGLVVAVRRGLWPSARGGLSVADEPRACCLGDWLFLGQPAGVYSRVRVDARPRFQA